MGLDWNPLARPKPGMEAEFEHLFHQLNASRGPSLLGFLSDLFKGPGAERKLRQRFQEISEPAYAFLGAPRVGFDGAADAWLREKVGTSDRVAYERARKEMHGYYVLDLLPPCDGFPPYTNYPAYEGLDRYSFRGAFLEYVKDIIGADLHARAWNAMLARDLGAYASALEARARPWAERARVAHIETAAESPAFAEHDPASQADILFSAIRWCRFWASRGHGLEPWF